MRCPAGLLVSFFLVLLSLRLFVSLVLSRSSLCLGGPRWFCLVVCLVGLVSLSVVALASPAVALVQFFAGTSLWVSGCSCDGLVALL